MTRHGSYGPPPVDPERVAGWIRDNNLATTLHRRGLVVRRQPWRRGVHVPLDERIAADPHRALHQVARLVASELRATGQAVTIPAEQQTLADRYRRLGLRGEIVAGVMAAVLVIVVIALLVWQLT